MYLGLDFLWSEDFLYYAIFINKISGAKDTYGLSAACHLLAPASKLLQQSGFGISNERELQALGFGELLLKRLFVLAHSDYLISGSSKFILVCLQGTCLCSTATGICLRIAIKYYLAATIITRVYLTSVLVNTKDLWYSISNIHICNFLYVHYDKIYDPNRNASPLIPI